MSSGCTCRRTPTRCCPPLTTACAAGTTSTSWWPANNRCWICWTPNRPACTAPAGSACSSGRATTVVGIPTSCWRVPATCRPWRCWLRRRSCASTYRTSGCEWSTWWTSCACSRIRSIRTACATREFDALFTTDKPIIFNYHGYPWLIHRLTYSRAGHDNLHVRGYKEEGTTTTPFDMCVRNDIDRFHLVIDVIDRVPGLGVPCGRSSPGDGGPATRARALHPGARRGSARGQGMGMAVLNRRRPARAHSLRS